MRLSAAGAVDAAAAARALHLHGSVSRIVVVDGGVVGSPGGIGYSALCPGHVDGGDVCAGDKGCSIDTGRRPFERERYQSGAASERTAPNSRDPVRQRRQSKIPAVIERAVSDARDPVRQRRQSKIPAVVERSAFYFRETVRQGRQCKTGAIAECTAPNARETA